MTNFINQISSLSGLSTTNAQNTTTNSSTSDILASFKDILSTMTMTNGGSFSGQQSGSGIGDLMTPLLMIILLEKLVESQMDQTGVANGTQTGNSINQNPKSEPSGHPVGGILTQEFHPGHAGLDLAVVVGTPVKSTMDGKVIHAGWNNQGYGNLVIVENGPYKTYYAHLSSIPVSVGDSVAAGSTIGLSGNTGNSTGPHLHYEIRKNNVPVDPAPVTLDA